MICPLVSAFGLKQSQANCCRKGDFGLVIKVQSDAFDPPGLLEVATLELGLVGCVGVHPWE